VVLQSRALVVATLVLVDQQAPLEADNFQQVQASSKQEKQANKKSKHSLKK